MHGCLETGFFTEFVSNNEIFLKKTDFFGRKCVSSVMKERGKIEGFSP
jgi:hypothetical protein